jgi:hypothetical protein
MDGDGMPIPITISTHIFDFKWIFGLQIFGWLPPLQRAERWTNVQ